MSDKVGLDIPLLNQLMNCWDDAMFDDVKEFGAILAGAQQVSQTRLADGLVSVKNAPLHGSPEGALARPAANDDRPVPPAGQNDTGTRTAA